MRLTLYRDDLLPEFKNINCSQTRFEHFSEKAKEAIRLVGKATFREHDHSNYNAIYLED